MRRVKATGYGKGRTVDVYPSPASNKVVLALEEVRDNGGVIETNVIPLTRSQVRRLIKHLEEACDDHKG